MINGSQCDKNAAESNEWSGKRINFVAQSRFSEKKHEERKEFPRISSIWICKNILTDWLLEQNNY